jgi:2-haloacid dehalogenase
VRYHTVLFDADDTLFDYGKAERYALEKACTQYKVSFSEALLRDYRACNERLWRLFERRMLSKITLQHRRFVELFALRGLGGLDPDAFNRDYVFFLGEGGFLNDGALDVCQALAPRVTLAVVTNGIEATQAARLKHSALNGLIPWLFVSESAGCAKPERAYFADVFRRLGLTRTDGVLMVGDALASDIKGGLDFGLDTCWYNPNRLEPPAGHSPKFQIHHLREVLGIV